MQTRARVMNSTPQKTQAAFRLSLSFRSLYITPCVLVSSHKLVSLFLEQGAHPRKLRQEETCSFPRVDLPLNSFTPADHRKPVKTTKRRRGEKLTWKGLKKRHFALTFPVRSKRSRRITTTMPAFTVHAAAVRWGKSPHHAARFFPQINVSWRGLNG